ncbi:MAG: hypothetical protein HY320_14020, partial [Armatimonadetes bacterium]|nr:hypothetical protein [Armatimonadota bacterium]
MTSQTPDWQAVLARLERLEAQNRRWKMAVLAACLLAGAALLTAPAVSQEQRGRMVTAERFVLVDARGNTRATLGATAEGAPRLDLLDAAGK